MPYETATARLTAQRAEIVGQLEELGASESGDLGNDVDFGEGFADAAAATSERTEVLGIIEALVTRLRQVDAALARISDGTYGLCANCGKEIGAARLEHRPESVYCIDCKAANASG